MHDSSITAPDPVITARQNGLRYLRDDSPGITRQRHGRGFSYHDPQGTLISAPDVLARVQALALPPSWEEVWISPCADGHLQATGRDGRGRKQYRYHPQWRLLRDDSGQARLISFAQALPAMRRAVQEDLLRPGLTRDKVLASLVQLLQTSLMGSPTAAAPPRLQRDDGSDVLLRFHGKGDVAHAMKLHDPYVLRILRKLRDLPGQPLLDYDDAHQALQHIGSAEVNGYLRELSGEDFTARDFRNWAGTVLVATTLQADARCDAQAQARRNVVCAIDYAAQRLGQTPTLCRKQHVHPAVLQAYLDNRLADLLDHPMAAPGLSTIEAAVLALLRQHQHDGDDAAARPVQSRSAHSGNPAVVPPQQQHQQPRT